MSDADALGPPKFGFFSRQAAMSSGLGVVGAATVEPLPPAAAFLSVLRGGMSARLP